MQRTINDMWLEQSSSLAPDTYMSWNDFMIVISSLLNEYAGDPSNILNYKKGLLEAAIALRR